MSPPPHPTAQDIARAPRRHRLFGYPISHSASPAFQNTILQHGISSSSGSGSGSGSSSSSAPAAPTYSLCETKSVDEAHFYQLVRHDDRFGGAGVTMPLKVSVTARLGSDEGAVLDELDDVGSATQTVNTIVVLPSLAGETAVDKRRMVGTNTDYLGIRHAILRDVAKQAGHADAAHFYNRGPSVVARFPLASNGKPHSAFIIGSGGTCRSAVYALHNLGLSPLYLINRDAGETQDVVDHFRAKQSGIDLRPLRSVEAFDEEQAKRQRGEVGPVAAAVGAIPAMDPVTAEEKMVYTLAHRFLDERYEADAAVNAASTSTNESGSDASTLLLPLLPRRPFLDMCYKPRLTPLLAYAGRDQAGATWSPIGGVEAMVEQGLAQARMWAASACILDGRLPSDDPLSYATRAGDDGPLGAACEDEARRLVETMSDV
ncbi:hypothetical protein FA10DRAFT_242186, partial [Acaromyces ingoldii]